MKEDHSSHQHNALTKGDLEKVESRLAALLEKIIHKLFGKSKRSPSHFGYAVGQPENKEKVITMLDLKITNEQQIPVALKPVTATGKPAKLDGSAAFTVLSGNSTVIPGDDGLSALLVSSDDAGVTVISVKADADLGEGVEEISDVINLTVTSATAANLGLTAGTPEPKPTV